MENMRRIANKIQDISNEDTELIKIFHSLKLSKNDKILDIGCGFGTKIKLLRTHGLNAIGVDVNQSIISSNLESGIDCLLVDEFNLTNDLYDVLLMAHIIEHFKPDDLVKFMDNYLDRLKTGGYLVIATPLLSPYFYEDFDHVKPYHPTGVEMVFGNNDSQVQYYSKNKLKLMNILYRKGPFKIIHYSGLYVRNNYSRLLIAINVILAFLYRISFGLIGRTDGWVGLYKKVST